MTKQKEEIKKQEKILRFNICLKSFFFFDFQVRNVNKNNEDLPNQTFILTFMK